MATAHWFRAVLSPAAARFVSEEKSDPLDVSGAALEVISVVSLSMSLAVLEAGLGYAAVAASNVDSSEPFKTTAPKEKVDNYVSTVNPDLRAFETLRSNGLSVTQTESIGWAGYVNDADGKILSASSKGARGLRFSSDLPFKSLSLCFGEFRCANNLMEDLYLAPSRFNDFAAGRRHMNRTDMETLSMHYTSERKCDF